MKKNKFVVNINPEEWKTYGFKEKMAYLKKMLIDNSGSITDSLYKNAEDVLDTIRNASADESMLRRYSDLGIFALKASKFLNDMAIKFTREKTMVTSQYDYILKYLTETDRDDLYVNDVVLNSELLRLFAENVNKLEETGVFKINKLEYGNPDKPSDVQLNLVITLNNDNVFGLKDFKFFIRCEYHKSAEVKFKETTIVPTGTFIAAYDMGPLEEFEVDFSDYDDIFRLILRIALENYVSNIDVQHNFIKLEPYGDMRTIKRPNISFNINNFDMQSMVKEIKTCLKKNRHRGYMFIGDPGTGKTVSILKFLDEFKDIPVFWVDSSTLQSSGSIRDIFKTLHYFPKSICIFDDIDAVDLSYKSAATTAFIECMDNKDDFLSYDGITIMTVNEPNRVHSSIKTRSGRIDQIIYIPNPNTPEKVHDIITQRYVNANTDMPSEFTLDNECFKQYVNMCIENNFTHAHIAGIIDDIILFREDMDVDCEIVEHFGNLVENKVESLRNANLKTKDGYLDTGKQINVKHM